MAHIVDELGLDDYALFAWDARSHGHSPAGRYGIGGGIDRAYPTSIGWRGIRQRRAHIESLLQAVITRLLDADRPVHILDIAAGHGRYVLEALDGGAVQPASVRLRDFDARNVDAGQTLIESKGLADTAHFEQGDAFDESGLAAVEPRPTLAIVSGLYELFSDNTLLAQSLAGLHAAVEPGGYLIYTGQPWHPQLAFTARALTSHRGGDAWMMRRRTQAEMDALVAHAGFEKIDQRIDEWGIFTVSLARRVER